MDIRDLNQSEIHPKQTEGITNMLFQFAEIRFYAEALMYVNFKRQDDVNTMGVTIVNGTPTLYWAQEFTDKLTLPECNYVLIHEMMHLLSNHGSRGIRLSHMYMDYSHGLGNVAMDMIINTGINEMKLNKNHAVMPNMGWVLRTYYKGNQLFEDVYVWLIEQKHTYEAWKKANPGHGNSHRKIDPNNPPSPFEEKFSDGCPIEDAIRRLFDEPEGRGSMDNHDLLKDVPEDLRDAVVKDMLQGLKNRGLVPASIEALLEKINPSKKDHLKEILSGLAFVKGKNKSGTFTRLNRRGIEGMKGKIKHGAELNVVLDVSGSMSGMVERVLSVIFRDGIVAHIAQCDAEVHNITHAQKRSDIQRMKLEGMGGTMLQPAVDMFKKDKDLKHLNLVVLTDGYCDSLDLSGFKKVLLVSCGEKVPVSKKASHVRHVKIAEEK
jgi:predicted metal-dependent peptidase